MEIWQHWLTLPLGSNLLSLRRWNIFAMIPIPLPLELHSLHYKFFPFFFFFFFPVPVWTQRHESSHKLHFLWSMQGHTWMGHWRITNLGPSLCLLPTLQQNVTARRERIKWVTERKRRPFSTKAPIPMKQLWMKDKENKLYF